MFNKLSLVIQQLFIVGSIQPWLCIGLMIKVNTDNLLQTEYKRFVSTRMLLGNTFQQRKTQPTSEVEEERGSIMVKQSCRMASSTSSGIDTR
jgi:hypothetical protein